jgi:hypothetical protein
MIWMIHDEIFCQASLVRSRNPILFMQLCQSARSDLTIAGTEFRLESSLKREFQSDGIHFNLKGKLTIVAVNGSWPQGVHASHFCLKPSWKGFPWYPWNLAIKFQQPPRNEAGKIVIDFIRREQGGLVGERPEHFAKYDVRVVLFDEKSHRYVLTNLGVTAD